MAGFETGLHPLLVDALDRLKLVEEESSPESCGLIVHSVARFDPRLPGSSGFSGSQPGYQCLPSTFSVHVDSSLLRVATRPRTVSPLAECGATGYQVRRSFNFSRSARSCSSAAVGSRPEDAETGCHQDATYCLSILVANEAVRSECDTFRTESWTRTSSAEQSHSAASSRTVTTALLPSILAR